MAGRETNAPYYDHASAELRLNVGALPPRNSQWRVHVADHVLVRVHTDDGVIGIADAPPRPYTYGETQESIMAVIDKIFAPHLVGLGALDRELIHTRMSRTVGNHAAKAAVDMAL